MVGTKRTSVRSIRSRNGKAELQELKKRIQISDQEL